MLWVNLDGKGPLLLMELKAKVEVKLLVLFYEICT